MFQQPNLIANNPNLSSAFLPPLVAARAAGPVDEYSFLQIKPKKKLKEIIKVLKAEKKKFLFIKYGWKFNLKDRCVVCGVHHVWDSGDYMRPPLPLSHVSKGRPMRGTYCPKHATHHRQMEMLQQQILADEHGLDFKAFMPKPRMPQVLSKGPLTTLSKADVISLVGAGWIINSPEPTTDENKLEEIIRLTDRIRTDSERMNALITKRDE
tara:strand:+ start:14847 stop:15476 length:630 start_codon:yes stop_codon:yes gene_type:complete